mmetsp:Transcript_16677/g.35210  ORF Transcript_16677/g.35210 Transcript_16677/m.35210 type:complete len:85 (-) Transcript_16677:636-890(-)
MTFHIRRIPSTRSLCRRRCCLALRSILLRRPASCERGESSLFVSLNDGDGDSSSREDDGGDNVPLPLRVEFSELDGKKNVGMNH